MTAKKTAGSIFIAYNRLVILLFLTGVVCLGLPFAVHAQDSVPNRVKIPVTPGVEQRFQVLLSPEISELKISLSRRIKDADDATELLQKAKTLNYIPGQVVALCDLAAIDDEEKPDASAGDLQEAQRIASQIKEMPEASWAMHQIAKLNRDSPNKSAKFKSSLANVIKALAQAMQNGSFVIHMRQPPKQNDVDEEDPDVSGQKMKLNLQLMKDIPGGKSHFSRHDFSDHWLDSIILKGHSNDVQAIRLSMQKKSA